MEQLELEPVAVFCVFCPGRGPPEAVVDDLLPLNSEMPVAEAVGLTSTVGVEVLVADGVTAGVVEIVGAGAGLFVGVPVDDSDGVGVLPGVAITVTAGGGVDVGVIPAVGVV